MTTDYEFSAVPWYAPAMGAYMTGRDAPAPSAQDPERGRVAFFAFYKDAGYQAWDCAHELEQADWTRCWNAVAAHATAPLLRRIADLEATCTAALAEVQRLCDLAEAHGACVDEPATLGQRVELLVEQRNELGTDLDRVTEERDTALARVAALQADLDACVASNKVANKQLAFVRSCRDEAIRQREEERTRREVAEKRVADLEREAEGRAGALPLDVDKLWGVFVDAFSAGKVTNGGHVTQSQACGAAAVARAVAGALLSDDAVRAAKLAWAEGTGPTTDDDMRAALRAGAAVALGPGLAPVSDVDEREPDHSEVGAVAHDSEDEQFITKWLSAFDVSESQHGEANVEVARHALTPAAVRSVRDLARAVAALCRRVDGATRSAAGGGRE